MLVPALTLLTGFGQIFLPAWFCDMYAGIAAVKWTPVQPSPAGLNGAAAALHALRGHFFGLSRVPRPVDPAMQRASTTAAPKPGSAPACLSGSTCRLYTLLFSCYVHPSVHPSARLPFYKIRLAPQPAGTKRAAGVASDGTGAYELLSDAATGTVTIALSKSKDPTITTAINVTQCTATFKLIAGYAFDLAPPAGATCPANALSVKLGRRSFCKFCPVGQYKSTSTGKCAPCADGTYQDQAGSTSCKACPPGFSCRHAEYKVPCELGSYSKPGAATCNPCPANTYANKLEGATACNKCPMFTIAPAGSASCYVPWDK
jgi:hypothetical protein